MTKEELKQLADLSDQVIKLKQLIKEMQLRVVSFENSRDMNKVLDPQYHYWDGKRSEASFITEKLLNIFGENEADENQPSCLCAAQTDANTVLAAVPYQCCPLCNGNGQTVADGFTSSVYQTCKVCNGAMIIPMHIVDWRFAVKA